MGGVGMAHLNLMEDEVRAIRSRFKEGLDDRLAELEQLYHMIGRVEKRDDLYEAVRIRAHKLAGISGTLGFSELGQLAARCEDQIVGFMADTATACGNEILKSIEAVLDEIDRILESD